MSSSASAPMFLSLRTSYVIGAALPIGESSSPNLRRGLGAPVNAPVIHLTGPLQPYKVYYF
jgi:hypothetical protein